LEIVAMPSMTACTRPR